MIVKKVKGGENIVDKSDGFQLVNNSARRSSTTLKTITKANLFVVLNDMYLRR